MSRHFIWVSFVDQMQMQENLQQNNETHLIYQYLIGIMKQHFHGSTSVYQSLKIYSFCSLVWIPKKHHWINETGKERNLWEMIRIYLKKTGEKYWNIQMHVSERKSYIDLWKLQIILMKKNVLIINHRCLSFFNTI